MKLSDVGWVWEGHGLDPGVYPSIFGVGEGADFFGLRKVRFLFHPTNDLVLQKLSDKEEVVCDISKWGFRDVEHGGSACTKLGGLETVLSEAEKISAYSQTYPNVTGAYYDDMKGTHGKGRPRRRRVCPNPRRRQTPQSQPATRVRRLLSRTRRTRVLAALDPIHRRGRAVGLGLSAHRVTAGLTSCDAGNSFPTFPS